MNAPAETPQAGEIIWTDFDPVMGREQSGRSGEILVSHMRSIDLLARPVRRNGTFAPADTFEQVKNKLRLLLGLVA